MNDRLSEIIRKGDALVAIQAEIHLVQNRDPDCAELQHLKNLFNKVKELEPVTLNAVAMTKQEAHRWAWDYCHNEHHWDEPCSGCQSIARGLLRLLTPPPKDKK